MRMYVASGFSRTKVLALGALLTCAASVVAQQPAPVPLARFAGTWVGTQAWAIPNPPPGSRQDQPVTLTIRALSRLDKSSVVNGDCASELAGSQSMRIMSTVRSDDRSTL